MYLLHLGFKVHVCLNRVVDPIADARGPCHLHGGIHEHAPCKARHALLQLAEAAVLLDIHHRGVGLASQPCELFFDARELTRCLIACPHRESRRASRELPDATLVDADRCQISSFDARERALEPSRASGRLDRRRSHPVKSTGRGSSGSFHAFEAFPRIIELAGQFVLELERCREHVITTGHESSSPFLPPEYSAAP